MLWFCHDLSNTNKLETHSHSGVGLLYQWTVAMEALLQEP